MQRTQEQTTLEISQSFSSTTREFTGEKVSVEWGKNLGKAKESELQMEAGQSWGNFPSFYGVKIFPKRGKILSEKELLETEREALR